MTRFNGTLSGDGKTTTVSGEYRVGEDNSVHGVLSVPRKIDCGVFMLRTSGGETFDVVVTPQRAKQSSRKVIAGKLADFTGRVV